MLAVLRLLVVLPDVSHLCYLRERTLLRLAAVLGMSTTWYSGVLAKMIGDTGGDIGNELSFAFTLLVYLPARVVEKRIIGR